MTHLVLVRFPDFLAAQTAGVALATLQDRVGTEAEDIVIVSQGSATSVKLDHLTRPSTGRALGGGRWGTLIGTLFAADPGSKSGPFRRAGLAPAFLDTAAALLDGGGAVLGLRVRLLGLDRVLDRLSTLAVTGRVLHTKLSPASEAALAEMAAEVPEAMTQRLRAG
jgi:uncharacterized membrane protein